MRVLSSFIRSVLAGVCIALGGMTFLSVDSRVIGAALFTVGLFTICTSGLDLFTGKVCYAPQSPKEDNLLLPIIWLGNFIGTGMLAGIVHLTRINSIATRAAEMCQIKTNDSVLSLFLLGLLCNIFIYIAVDGYRSNQHTVGKYLSLFLGVMGFILCGTEHCVADMFYFWCAGSMSVNSLVCIITVSAGNALGGMAFPFLKNLAAKLLTSPAK